MSKINEFVDLIGLEDKYSINTNGDIYSKRLKRLVKPKLTNSGYLQVQLGRGNYFYIHRLLAYNFLENPHNKKTVNHKDGNKMNNSVDNLEWSSYSENLQHALDNKLRIPNNGRKGVFGKDNPIAKKIAQISLTDNSIINTFYGVYEAFRITGVSRGNINSVCNGQRQTAGGFIWKYV